MGHTRERMAVVRNYALYYGSERPDTLAGFDLVVLEPRAWSEGGIQELRAGGALVCGYLSVLETNDLFEMRSARASDYLRIADARKRNASSSGWVMDPRSSHWAEVVLEMAGRQVIAKGCDGMLLDTIGDVEDPELPESLAAELIPAAAVLVKKIRDRFPDAILIQNWGIGVLHRLTVPYLDAVLWENFPLKWPGDRWSLSKLGELERMSRSTGIRILLLTQMNGGMSDGLHAWEETDGVRLEATRRGFLSYAAPGSYTGGVSARFSGG